MSNITIQPVATRRQKKQFLEFPWTLYRGDPNWIPPLRGNQKEMVGYRPHPFYDRNSIQTFVAYRGDEVRGRIAAILNRGHIHQHDDRCGFFGFFECFDDQEAADGLFDAVRRWFADQDIHRLRGPTNPSLNHELGLLIEGFDSPPSFMMTYNPPYYERLIEYYGFRKSQDLYAFWGHVDMLPGIGAKLNPIAEQIIERYGVKLRSLDTSRFQEDVELFLSLYNRSLANTWGFVPMSADEISHMARGLRKIIAPELTVAAEIDERVVGAAFGLPDYNPRIKEIDGRLFPFGFIHLLRNRRAIKRIRMISTNVLPEYQRLGVGLVLMYGLLPKALDWGLEEAEFSWVLESNALSYGSLKKGGAKISKTYRLYDLNERREERGERGEEGGSPLAASRKNTTPITSFPAPRPSSLAPLQIRQVNDRRDLDQFIELPWRVYAADPHWVPPLLLEVKEFLDPRKHPFYKHGEATQFIALRGGQCVGRILASDDSRYNRQHNSNTGCFGMFDCLDDRPAAHALLDAAADWLVARGRTAVIGPIDYSTNYPCGLLIEGFETPPRIMMNHNRPYYADLLESWRLRKAKDLYAWWFVDPHDLASRWRRRVERIARRSGVTVRPFRTDDFAADVTRCKEIYNAAMRDLWGFVELTEAEFRYMAKQLKRLAIADQVLLAEIDGRPVGFSITLPDINEAIRPLNGRLTHWGLPLGMLRFLRRKRRIKTARMVVLDVLKEYRRRGVAEMLILRTLDYGKNVLGYTGAELSWTFEDNDLVNRPIEAVGAKRYKTYRIYEKEIGA
ncbi:MAG: GNAT family N-acetyltransferase [Pirellulales bacterium]|nr:GNAT family N-acetyltransferase [Pirellulales bacterium]